MKYGNCNCKSMGSAIGTSAPWQRRRHSRVAGSRSPPRLGAAGSREATTHLEEPVMLSAMGRAFLNCLHSGGSMCKVALRCHPSSSAWHGHSVAAYSLMQPDRPGVRSTPHLPMCSLWQPGMPAGPVPPLPPLLLPPPCATAAVSSSPVPPRSFAGFVGQVTPLTAGGAAWPEQLRLLCNGYENYMGSSHTLGTGQVAALVTLGHACSTSDGTTANAAPCLE
jgi:hypothetical protein